MSYVATIQIDLDAHSREAIEARMSTVMSGYVDKLQERSAAKVSMAEWTYEEWKAFVSTAFDVAAVEVFTRRVVLIPPELTDYGVAK